MTRAERLAKLVAERELDMLFVSDLVNVRYLTGFTGTNGACLVGGDQSIFFTDFRYTERARNEVGRVGAPGGGARARAPDRRAHERKGGIEGLQAQRPPAHAPRERRGGRGGAGSGG